MINKSLDIKSRFFFAPINTGLALNGNPTDELINFHALRSNKYTGINYVGNISINADSITNPGTLAITESMANYEKLVQKIEEKQSLPGAQLACLYSRYRPLRNWKNPNPDEYIEAIQKEMIAMTLKEIKGIIKDFVIAFKKLVSVGFKVIQLHAAHGYLLNNFLSATFNSRKDEFGTDRCLIVKEIINGVGSVLKDIILDIRISAFEFEIQPSLEKNSISFLDKIYSLQEIDMISLSNGIYNINKRLIYPDKRIEEAFMVNIMNNHIKSRSNKIWNVCGNIREVLKLQDMNNNLTFAIGRPIIADSDFLVKCFENRRDDVVECLYKNQCHYYSLEKPFIQCGVNKHLF